MSKNPRIEYIPTDSDSDSNNSDDISLGFSPKKLAEKLKRLGFGGRKTRKRKRSKSKTKKNNKKRKKNKTVKKGKCSPKLKKNVLEYTCYTSKSLNKIKNIWNKKHPEIKIYTNDPYTIWKSLHLIFKKSCNKEACWLKHKCLKEHIDLDIKKHTFAPDAPKEWKKNPNEWLTSVDIIDIMKQYEKTYKCFDFIGPSPIDYDKHVAYGECVWEELCEFSLNKSLAEGKRKIGIIFNLDTHDKPGSHWVALFIDTKKNNIYYLDSYGDNPPRQIKRFSEKVQNQSLKVGNKRKYKFLVNRKRHQFGNSECGMYCLYFIIEMLKGRNFNKFLKKKIKDKYMEKLRKIYFNH